MEPHAYGLPQLVNSWWKDIFIRDIDATNGYFRGIRLVSSTTTDKKSSNYILIWGRNPAGFTQYFPAVSGDMIVFGTAYYTSTGTNNNYQLGNESFALFDSSSADAIFTGFFSLDVNSDSLSPDDAKEFIFACTDNSGNGREVRLVHNSGSSSVPIYCATNIDIVLKNNDMAKLVYDQNLAIWRASKMGNIWSTYTLS